MQSGADGTTASAAATQRTRCTGGVPRRRAVPESSFWLQRQVHRKCLVQFNSNDCEGYRVQLAFVHPSTCGVHRFTMLTHLTTATDPSEYRSTPTSQTTGRPPTATSSPCLADYGRRVTRTFNALSTQHAPNETRTQHPLHSTTPSLLPLAPHHHGTARAIGGQDSSTCIFRQVRRMPKNLTGL